LNLSIIVLTWNEERNLPACLESLATLGARLFVVDSGSTDATCDIARRCGARIYNHPFQSHALQWAWALDNLPLESEWVLALDADQRLSPDLAAEIANLFSRPIPPEIEGFYLNRRQIFRGRWIRHGGYYPKYLLKLFRRPAVRFDENDLVDHHFYVLGRTEKLRADMIEDNQKENDITFWIEKHNRYAALMACEEHRRRAGSVSPLAPGLFGSPDSRTLALKAYWRGLPLYVRPVLYFLYRYFVQFGWMDGKEGFLFHFLHALWFRLLIDIKVDELSRTMNSRNSQIIRSNAQ
jgi:glycosyltransferase involved in cell wall biosynthesis